MNHDSRGIDRRDNAINYDEKQSNYNIVYESSDTCYHKIKQKCACLFLFFCIHANNNNNKKRAIIKRHRKARGLTMIRSVILQTLDGILT